MNNEDNEEWDIHQRVTTSYKAELQVVLFRQSMEYTILPLFPKVCLFLGSFTVAILDTLLAQLSYILSSCSREENTHGTNSGDSSGLMRLL